jgi:precorrin-6Y C5,15-methyltransferase (decarboxylating)
MLRMAEGPWLTIVGLGEDGPDGLTPASRAALEAAEVVMGAARHLALLPGFGAERVVWPVPFFDGLPVLMGLRGRQVVLLASGDPFWFGAGTSVTTILTPGEWLALPAPSTFSLAASRLGWGLESVVCLGLHATPLETLRRHLAPGRRILVLLRDGAAAGTLAERLFVWGFGATRMVVMEALGGPRERVREVGAASYDLADVAHPVAVALEVEGDGVVLAGASGLPDALFMHDGQITKRPVRALALSALAPRPGELLWDVGAGSGSVGIEWMLSDPSCRAIGVEADSGRAERAELNAAVLGVAWQGLVRGRAPEALNGLTIPDAVFVGGGVSEALLAALWARLPAGVRVVVHAVTLESEALLAHWQASEGGSLLRIELAEAGPLGRRRGWKAAYPVVQWSVVR